MEIVEDTLGPDIDIFLSRPLFAHLATTCDAGPRESPVWYLWEDGVMWINGDRETDSFPGRVEQDPRCAVGVVDSDSTRGLIQHVGMRGAASVVPFERERGKRLLSRYLGPDPDAWDPRFRSFITNPAESSVFVKFVPETVVARDQSYAPTPGV
ncbi:pyridoxamine 5'-phosphate oxidase family protein [Natronomonas sp. EA1]|uniref:pyridoxamine 5'-phosphate oxidase family protein n=1 Tax=Natronomonas sp. EA1 TaxID=3421655 RepID=UPI003EC072D4